MTLAFNVKRSALLCALALTAPTFVMAEDTVVVTAAPAPTSTSTTEGYTSPVSKGATNR